MGGAAGCEAVGTVSCKGEVGWRTIWRVAFGQPFATHGSLCEAHYNEAAALTPDERRVVEAHQRTTLRETISGEGG